MGYTVKSKEESMVEKEVDLAVIGAGPAGMAAAIRARESGLQDILILERAEYPGGLLHQCIHNGFGLHYFKEDLTGPEYARRFMNKLESNRISICLDTMVTHLTSDRIMTAINSQWGEFKVNAHSIVLAMGCRERTRPSLGIPGSRPSGIFTAGLAQKLVNVDGYMPGEKFVILGSGDIGLIMARRLHLEGAKVEAVVEIMSHVGGLIRNEVQCLHDFDIPLLLEHTVTEIYGNERIEGVRVAQVRNGEILEGTEKVVPCDCLLLSVGLIPENELTLQAGIELDDCTGGALVDEHLQTKVEGIFSAGNVLQVYDLVDNVTLDGEKAGLNAAQFVEGSLGRSERELHITLGENIRSVTPQRITGADGVEFSLRVTKSIEKAEIHIGQYRKNLRIANPTEIIKLFVPKQELEPLRKLGEITISCSKSVKEAEIG